MAFTNNFRIERIYFEKLKSNIDILKSYIEAGATGEALELLKNSVDVDGAVLLLYRNLGEAWAELADLIQKTQKDLKDLAEKTEAYHDELNERIDEVNNYLVSLIRELDARLQVVEQDLATMNRNKFYDLIEDDNVYSIEKDGETVSFDDIKADADFPHNVILRYDNGTSVTELEIREFTDSRIDFYSIGLTDSDKTVKEILVSIADTEAVTYSENTLVNPLYTFGTGLSLDSNNELSVDFSTVQAKLTEGTGIDIDSNNEISVDTTVIQEKLTEGTGIDIDSSNNISVDTTVIQEKLTEGSGIDIDSNNEISVDTTVIQAKLTEGFGIDIDSNNEIKVDTADVQEKLIAGQNITLTPDTTDPTKTVIDAGGSAYSAGTGINIDLNNTISVNTNQIQSKLTPLGGIKIDSSNNVQMQGTYPFTFSRTILDSDTGLTGNFSKDALRYYRHKGVKLQSTDKVLLFEINMQPIMANGAFMSFLNNLQNKYHLYYKMALWVSNSSNLETDSARFTINLERELKLDNGVYYPVEVRSGTGKGDQLYNTFILPFISPNNYYVHMTQEIRTLEDSDFQSALNADSNAISNFNSYMTARIYAINN